MEAATPHSGIRGIACSRSSILIGFVLVLLTIAVYTPVLDCLMVADDFRKIGGNEFEQAIRSLHGTAGIGRNEYRPVVDVSFALSKLLWNGDARGYHFDSIVLHTLNVLLLFFLLRLLGQPVIISGMAAALFSVHPLCHERVAWIAARDGLLSTLFMLLSIFAYMLARGREFKPVGLGLSLGFFLFGLISYEGSIVLPGIMLALELVLMRGGDPHVKIRLWNAFLNIRWHVCVLIFYFLWWVVLFRGEAGQYNPSWAIGNALHNYYRLLYQLFYGNSRLLGVLYFGLLFAVFLMPRPHRRLAAFSLIWVLFSFFPFAFSSGFADRFAYFSSMGYAVVLALMIYAITAARRREIGLALGVIIFLTFSGYYIRGLRSRLSDWKRAGQIADSIPRQIKKLYPDLPDGARLVLTGIPRLHGHAYVYPVGLEYSVSRFYPGKKLQVLYGADPDSGGRREVQSFFFNYVDGAGTKPDSGTE